MAIPVPFVMQRSTPNVSGIADMIVKRGEIIRDTIEKSFASATLPFVVGPAMKRVQGHLNQATPNTQAARLEISALGMNPLISNSPFGKQVLASLQMGVMPYLDRIEDRQDKSEDRVFQTAQQERSFRNQRSLQDDEQEHAWGMQEERLKSDKEIAGMRGTSGGSTRLAVQDADEALAEWYQRVEQKTSTEAAAQKGLKDQSSKFADQFTKDRAAWLAAQSAFKEHLSGIGDDAKKKMISVADALLAEQKGGPDRMIDIREGLRTNDPELIARAHSGLGKDFSDKNWKMLGGKEKAYDLTQKMAELQARYIAARDTYKKTETSLLAENAEFGQIPKNQELAKRVATEVSKIAQQNKTRAEQLVGLADIQILTEDPEAADILDRYRAAGLTGEQLSNKARMMLGKLGETQRNYLRASTDAYSKRNLSDQEWEAYYKQALQRGSQASNDMPTGSAPSAEESTLPPETDLDEDGQFAKDVLDANRKQEWVQRIVNPNLVERYEPIPDPTDPKSGRTSTHLLAYSETEINGKKVYVVYPMVVRKENEDKLTYLGDDAYDYAMEREEYIAFDNKEDAERFSKNYKKPYPQAFEQKPKESKPKQKGEGKTTDNMTVLSNLRARVGARE